MKIKNKKAFTILILQIAFITLAVVTLLLIKIFGEKLFGEIEVSHTKYFEDETRIEEVKENYKGVKTISNNTVVNAFTIPLYGEITSHFGYRNDPFTQDYVKHYGTDIAADKGTQIVSAASGTVQYVGVDEDGYGNYLKISHSQTVTTLYGHCSEILVKEGDIVEAGQPVAKVGSTGMSTGNHLHFEIRINNEPVNAMWYLSWGEQ